MFSRCLGKIKENVYPAGFYLVKPFHLLNKAVLNKDNLSLNEATAWCECGAPSEEPRAPHRGRRPKPRHSPLSPTGRTGSGPGPASPRSRLGLRAEPVGEKRRLRGERGCRWRREPAGRAGGSPPPLRPGPPPRRAWQSCLGGVEVLAEVVVSFFRFLILVGSSGGGGGGLRRINISSGTISGVWGAVRRGLFVKGGERWAGGRSKAQGPSGGAE